MNADERTIREHLLKLVPRIVAEGTRITEAFAKQQKLHPTDVEALCLLGIADLQGEPLTAGSLGAELQLTSGATTFLLDRLERHGLVRRIRDHGDQRKILLEFADAGRKLLYEFFSPALERNHAVMDQFSKAELAVVERFLAATTEAMSDHLKIFLSPDHADRHRD